MDDLVLIVKNSQIDGVVRTGRPTRTKFSLRKYNASCVIAVPSHLITTSDRCEFYQSARGFAIQFTPDGSRAISKEHKSRTRTVSIPVEVSRIIADLPNGSQDMEAQELENRMYFFAFDQMKKGGL